MVNRKTKQNPKQNKTKPNKTKQNKTQNLVDVEGNEIKHCPDKLLPIWVHHFT